MPPKKRLRKKAKAKDEQTKPVVPLKKRKTLYDMYSDTPTSPPSDTSSPKELPEWFKLSIQILLINFYPEGVAILNNLETDYDVLFKGAKIDPAEYSFPDWESMLKSPQLKKHCRVYNYKMIPYCKGFPLPRSAAIMMREGVWEIDPNFIKRDRDLTPMLQSQFSASSSSSYITTSVKKIAPSSSLNHKSEEEEEEDMRFVNLLRLHKTDVDAHTDAASECSDTIRSPSLEREDETQVNDLISNRKMPTLPLVIPAEEVEILKYSSSESRPITPILLSTISSPINRGSPSPSITATVNDHSKSPEPSQTQPLAADVMDVGAMLEMENDLIDISNDEEDEPFLPMLSSNSEPTAFFRRSDVPPTWTQVLDDNEEDISPRRTRASEFVPEITDGGLEKSPSLENHPSLLQENKIVEKDEVTGAMMILHDSDSSSSHTPSPLPPVLSPQIKVVFEKTMSERVKERRQVLRDPRKLYISNSCLNGEGTPFTTNNRNRIDKNGHAITSISDSPDSGAENSVGSPESENSLILQEIFMPWKCTVVDVPGLDSPYLQALEKAAHESKVQNVHRDPRLSIGRRAEYFSFLQKGGETGEVDCRDGMRNDKRVENDKNVENVGSQPAEVTATSMPTMAQAGTSTSSHVSMQQSSEKNTDECEPNLSITIRNTDIDLNKRHIQMAVPLQRVSQLEHHLYIEDPIPIDPVTPSKVLRAGDLWSNVIWKDRLKQDSVSSRNFFNSDVYERWKNLKKRDVAPRRMELINELRKYEDKVFPSRCDFYLRTALRMVELDYRTNKQFSEPTDYNGDKLVGPDEILFYVDFTGAPGGVVEYYNKIMSWKSKGFGVTYQKRCYNLNSIPDIYPDFFEPFYGKLNGYHGDGNLFNKDTVDTFVHRVMEATDGKGVHVVSTVGNITGIVFEDANDENWKYQHLAQAMVALMLLREGGNLALKMYDLKQSFTVGLVYLLYRSFNTVRITKLNIFAPTSGERVIVCLGRKSWREVEGIVKFLQKCHRSLTDWYEKNSSRIKKSNKTIEEIIPFASLKNKGKFISYIRNSNERIKRTQIEELNTSLKNLRKTGSIFTRGLYRALVARTTELWKVPERVNCSSFKDKLVDSRNPLTSFRELRVPDNVCEVVEANLNEFNLYSIFTATEHWRFSPVGSKIKTRGFYLGVEGIPHFFHTKTKEWVPVRGNEFRLPSRTLIYGEIVPIFTKDGFLTEEIFTIIDALVLAGVEIKNLTYVERLFECEKFAMAVTKTFFPKMCKLTVTRTFDFMQLSKFLETVTTTPEVSETETSSSTLSTDKIASKDASENLRIPANSVYKLRGKSKDEKLWFNPSGLLFFEAGPNAKDFCSSLLSRVFWEWVIGMDIPPKPAGADDNGVPIILEESRPIGSVSAKKLIDFVNRYS